MNERIRELAESNDLIHEYMSTGERNDALKKFEFLAELIIRECSLLCAQEGQRTARIIPDADAKNYVKVSEQIGIMNACISNSKAILKHFGVGV